MKQVLASLSMISARHWVLASLLAIVALGGGIFLRVKMHKEPVAAVPDAQVAQANILAAVGRLIVLPTDEEPTIATVTDPQALAGQSFFANAKQGNKVLIYTKAQKAILYDVELNKIVEVAPVNLGNLGK